MSKTPQYILGNQFACVYKANISSITKKTMKEGSLTDCVPVLPINVQQFIAS